MGYVIYKRKGTKEMYLRNPWILPGYTSKKTKAHFFIDKEKAAAYLKFLGTKDKIKKEQS